MALTERDKTLLELEVAKGVQHAATWDKMVEPFFIEKHAELYEAFKNCPVRDKEGLLEIHAQTLALESMRLHFLHFIQTGTMAQKTLSDEEKEKNDGD